MNNTYAGLEKRMEFSAVDGHSYLDVVQYKTEGKKPTVKNKTLNHHQISPWLKQELSDIVGQHDIHDVKARLRVLVCNPKERSKARFVSFPVSRDVYTEIERAFGIDPSIIEHIAAEGCMTTEFRAFDVGYGISTNLKRKHLVITYDPASSTTYVLAQSSCEHGAKAFIKLVDQYQDDAPRVTAVVVAWMTEASQLRATSFLNNKEVILTVEGQMGMRLGEEGMQQRLKHSELQMNTQQLMLLNNAWDGTAIDCHLKQIAIFSDLKSHFALDSLISEQPPSQNLRLHMSQLRSLLIGLQAMQREIQQRADTVRLTNYNLILQRDNEINTKIAAAAKDDASAQKELAIQMKNIAVRTYIDSASMKTMTLINLCCLPGTLAACKTFFSTGFFDFSPKSSSNIVSPWIWLYVVITAALTGLLFLAWSIVSRRLLDEPPESGLPSTDDLRTLEKSEINPKGAANSSDTLHSSSVENISAVEAEEVDRAQLNGNARGAADAISDKERLITWLPARSQKHKCCS